jgi:hypothetical protein
VLLLLTASEALEWAIGRQGKDKPDHCASCGRVQHAGVEIHPHLRYRWRCRGGKQSGKSTSCRPLSRIRPSILFLNQEFLVHIVFINAESSRPHRQGITLKDLFDSEVGCPTGLAEYELEDTRTTACRVAVLSALQKESSIWPIGMLKRRIPPTCAHGVAARPQAALRTLEEMRAQREEHVAALAGRAAHIKDRQCLLCLLQLYRLAWLLPRQKPSKVC